MDSEFKEKTYEKYFGYEIARLTNHHTFSPDQCDEGFLGFDDAFWLPHDHLLRIGPYIRRSKSRRRVGYFLKELETLREEAVKRMPPFRFNLFVQYKRPAYLRTKGAGQWKHWKGPYYRYDVTPHQQVLLDDLVAASHNRAATVYAAAAFYLADDLWKYASSGEVIKQSNIASAGRLKAHGFYTYVKAGHVGKGHSETVNIESPQIQELISNGVESNDQMDAKAHILKTAATIREVVSRDEGRINLLQLAEAAYTFEDLSLSVAAYRPSALSKALTTLVAFSEAFETSTLMFGDEEPV
jgi:hypothetical protein